MNRKRAILIAAALLLAPAAVIAANVFVTEGIDFVDASVGVSASGHGRIRYNNSSHIFEQSLNGAAYTSFGGGGGSIGGSIAANQVAYGSGSNTIQGSSSFTYDGTALALTPAAVSSGFASPFSVTTPASTSLLASTEVPGALWSFSATRQWSTGALTTQREFYIKQPTYAFVGASTITTAATFDVQGPPLAGTNATITNAYALRVEAGTSLFENDSVGIAQTAGVRLQNITAATSGAANQKWSPGLELIGQQWNGSASVPVGWMVQNKPVSGNAAAGILSFNLSYNSGAYAEALEIFNGSATAASWTTLQNTTTSGGIALLSPASTGPGNAGYFQTNESIGAKFGYGNDFVLANGNNITAQSAYTDSAATLFFIVEGQNSVKSAGASAAAFYIGAGTYAQYYGMASGGTEFACSVAEDLTTSGTVTAGDVVVWASGSGRTVATAAATNNLTTIAGVAVTGAATGTTIKVCRHGRAVVSCDAGQTVGSLAGTSSGTAGHSQQGTAPGAGAIVGRYTAANSAVLGGITLGANQCVIDVQL